MWIIIDPDNAERLVDAIEDFGMGSVALQPSDYSQSDVVVQLGYLPVRSGPCVALQVPGNIAWRAPDSWPGVCGWSMGPSVDLAWAPPIA